MKNVYLKSSFKEISSSKGKFISIILIILLGTMLFVGVRSTGPDLSNSASSYVNNYLISPKMNLDNKSNIYYTA